MPRLCMIRRAAPCILLLLLVMLGASGCSKGNTASELNLVDSRGQHPAGWVANHPSFAAPDGSACASCHGGDLQGGISGVSCFSASQGSQGCHAGGPAFHPAGWLDKGAGAGFHGTASKNNVLIRNLACTDCHDPAIPNQPPGFICLDCHFDIAGTQRVPSGSTYPHGQIAGHHSPGIGDNGAVNSVCSNCHATNNRFGHMPRPLCHNCHAPFPQVFHPAGWDNPDQHGASAKAFPAATSGFTYCQICHGTDFAGGGNTPSCILNVNCHGSSNTPGATLLPNRAPHPPREWRASAGTARTHTTTASDNVTAAVCYACHRNRANAYNVPVPSPPYPGDATPAGCFNATLCHGVVGHPDPDWIRPLPGNHGDVAKNDVTYCQNCHADPSTGGPNPRFNRTIGSLANGCEKCHKTNTAHPPVDPAKILLLPPPDNGFPPAAHWYAHGEAGNFKNACTLCHGANLLGAGEGGVGPACTACHVTTPVNLATGDPVTGCGSCHGNPPSGTNYPNIGGAHGKINALPGVTGVCDTCHLGAGTGTRDKHLYDGTVDVAFLPAYNAKSGAASYNASGRTCAKTSCHGGQTTPDWRQAGSIIVNTDCLKCHESGTAQFNSYNSGQHDKHVNEEGIFCTECHDATRLAVNHFRFLDTHILEGPASATMQSGFDYNNPNPGSCNPNRVFGGGCHNTRVWF